MAAFRAFRPLMDRVLVQRVAAETKTKSGLFIPEKAQDKVNVATVIAIGPGRIAEDGGERPVVVKVGEKVLVPEYGGTKVNFEDTDYMLFRDGDILGVMDS
ncbi:10 kDa heat shock protein, mitochondrial-like isoform X2 [Halichondria panicea]|uniref:10 kDa heat shock protein, mitochondrial-like isoform X2 n=1 Tax=Halichondria panicea TaxID=6063 RepID=UPI00312B4E6C